MRMTFGEAVRLVFNQLGLNVLWVQLGIWVGLVLVTMMGFGSIVLSAWGWEWVTVVFLVFYIIFVLGVIYSPIVWGGISAVAVIAGQPGGEENLSLNDGINVLKRWAPIALDKMGLILIFWVPVWLLYTILFSTEGYVKENMLLFILIPTLVYFAKDEWSTGKLVLRIAGYVLVVIAVYVVGATVLGTVQQATVDPEVRLVQEYLGGLEAAEKKKIHGVVQVIINKKEAGKPISGLEQGILDELERRAKAQSLRPADLKAKAERFVESARPTQGSWWKENWLWLAGGVLALFVATRIWRAITRSEGATTVTVSAGHGTTKSTGKWTWALITLAVVGWCWYSIDQEVGFPGTWLVGKTHTISMTNLRSQQLCGVRPGMRRITVVNADQVMRVNGELVPIHAYFIKKDSDDLDPVRYNLAEYVRFNGTVPGEKTRVADNECLTVSAFDHLKEEVKEKTIILGKTASSEPEMAILMKVHVR